MDSESSVDGFSTGTPSASSIADAQPPISHDASSVDLNNYPIGADGAVSGSDSAQDVQSTGTYFPLLSSDLEYFPASSVSAASASSSSQVSNVPSLGAAAPLPRLEAPVSALALPQPLQQQGQSSSSSTSPPSLSDSLHNMTLTGWNGQNTTNPVDEDDAWLLIAAGLHQQQASSTSSSSRRTPSILQQRIPDSPPKHPPPLTPAVASEAPSMPPPPPQRKGRKHLKSTTDLLRKWLLDHAQHPYPTEAEKRMLCEQTGITQTQLGNWMINARRRILVPNKSGGSSAAGPSAISTPYMVSTRPTPSALATAHAHRAVSQEGATASHSPPIHRATVRSQRGVSASGGPSRTYSLPGPSASVSTSPTIISRQLHTSVPSILSIAAPSPRLPMSAVPSPTFAPSTSPHAALTSSGYRYTPPLTTTQRQQQEMAEYRAKFAAGAFGNWEGLAGPSSSSNSSTVIPGQPRSATSLGIGVDGKVGSFSVEQSPYQPPASAFPKFHQ